MSKYAITDGVQDSPVKTVLYGPEGIGKSTFASHFPDPVFIDTEGGTKRLNIKRLPQPTSWAMLLDEVAEAARWSSTPPTGPNGWPLMPSAPRQRWTGWRALATARATPT